MSNSIKIDNTIYDMSPYERYITGPFIPAFDTFKNKELCLYLFKHPRKTKCKFYMHYNPAIYIAGQRILHTPEIEILSEIKSKVIKVGWVHPNKSDQVLWCFKMIKTRKPINVIGLSIYLKECLIVRTLVGPVQVVRKDELWLSYVMDRNELNDPDKQTD